MKSFAVHYQMTTETHKENYSIIWLLFLWFYVLVHSGSCHMQATLQSHHHHAKLNAHIEHFECGKFQ